MADYRIRLMSELNTKGIDDAINKYDNKKIITFKSKVDPSGITDFLRGYKPKSVEVNTKLSTKGITEAIKKYQVKRVVELKSDLDTKGFDKKIEDYVPTKPIRVNVELIKGSINDDINEYNGTQAHNAPAILVKAKLEDDKIKDAVAEYKKTPVTIPVSVDPNFEGIDKKISGYTPRTLMKVNTKVNKGQIDKSIQDFKTSAYIKVKAKLEEGEIERAVNLYKPQSQVPVMVDFKMGNTDDVDKRILAYKRTPIEIPAKLIPAKTGFNKEITKTPIPIKATLDPEGINPVIEKFKPASKISVDVKLVPKDINAEVKNLPKPTEPLDVGVELNETSVNNAIANSHPTSLLGVGVDLKTDDVNEQIDNIITSSKIKVNVQLDNSDIDAETEKQKAQTPIEVNVKLNRENINKQIREFKPQSKIKVGVKLDFASHKDESGKEIQRGIASQIKKYQTKTKIKVGVQLDPNDIAQQIGNISAATPALIHVELDPNSVQNVQNQVDNLRQQIQALGNVPINLGGGNGNGGGNGGRRSGNGATNLQRALRDTSSIYKQIERMEKNLGDLEMSGADSGNIQAYRNQLDQLRQTYQALFATLHGQNGNIDFDLVSADIEQAKTDIAELSSFIENARAKLAKGVKIDVDNEGLLKKINAVEQKFNNLGIENQQVTEDIARLRTLLGQMDESNDIEAVTNDYREFLQLLSTVSNGVDNLQMEMNEENRPEILSVAKEDAMNRLNGLFEEGSQASKRFGARAAELREELNNVGNVKGVDIVNKKIKNLGAEVKNSHLQTQTLGTRLKEQFQKYANYLSVAQIIMWATQAMRSMFEQIKAIDTAMTELKKVTDETDESYNQFLSNAASKAKEIGTTIDGLVKSTADFARLGYGFQDAQGLAEVANIYAVVGDEVEGVEGATESLISTMAAFKDQANDLSNSDFAMSIVDKFNEIGNNFAISSGGIGEALKRSASSMAAANNTLDETIALITAANTVTQDPDVVGTAFKTMSMRIRGAKTEMEEAGIETDGMVESTAKLRQEILALSGVDIMLNANEFKSTYQILDELAVKWKDLTDIQQASITELIAGKRQGNVVSSLMNNFDTAREALETSLDSSGSAMKEHEKWQKSLEAQLNKLKAAWQGLSQAFLKSDFLKNALDAVIKFVDGITKLIDKVGALPVLFGVFASLKIVPNLFGKIGSTAKAAGGGIKSLGDVIALLQLSLPRMTELIEKFVASLKKGDDGSRGFTKSLKGIWDAFKQHWIIAVVVAVITALAAIFTHKAKQAEKLAAKVEELTEKYREQQKEVKKLKSDYDTSKEDSMISKYEKLSRGVDEFGRNVSLTAEEYSEYQSIVNKIAEQFPSLISGYDEQGNAILSVKGNVDALIEAYEKLIHTQNQEVLTKTGDIEKDFANSVQKSGGKHWWSNGHGFWAGLWGNGANIISRYSGLSNIDFVNQFASRMIDYELKEDTAQNIQKLLDGVSGSERDKVIQDIKFDRFSEEEIRDMLASAGFDVKFFEEPVKALERAIKEDPRKIQEVLDNYYAGFAGVVEEQKTIAQAVLSEAFDVNSVISGLNYGNIGEDLQEVANQVVNSLDYNFFKELQDSGKTVEQWTKEMLDGLNSISKFDNAEIEAGFELQTKFNGGEITYGEYVKNLQGLEGIIDNLDVKDELKEQLKIALSLDENGIVDQYNDLVNRLTDSKNYDFDISEDEAKKILDGLSAEELEIAVDVITDLSNNNYSENAEEIMNAIEREIAIRGLSLDLSIEVEKTKLEAVATAISESISGVGLSAESISAVEDMFKGLASYDPSKLFERTANGIRLNSAEYAKLNSEYKKTNIAEVNKQMDSLGDIYVQTREELSRLTYGTDEYNAKAAELKGIEEQIKYLEQLTAGYQGLASAYQEWQMVESAGSQRDMYEGIIGGLENIDDEIKRGWYDDATIEFLELLTGKDLSTAGIEEVKKAYKGLGKEIKHTSYSVRDFFTVDDEGNSTNAGVYNFLDAIGQMEEEMFNGQDVVKRDSKGNIIGFDFQIVGGDKAIAEALGISEELVQIMVRAADDAGFVVTMDGTYQQLDIVREKAQEAAVAMNEILGKNGKATIDIDMNADTIEEIQPQLDSIMNVFGERDKSGKLTGAIDMSIEGADEALEVAWTLQSMLDRLTRPAYMNLQVSQVDDDLQEPLRLMQQVRELTETKHKIELSGGDVTELNTDLDELYTELDELPDETKIEIGLVDDKGNPLTGQALKDKVNDMAEGEAELGIKATVDIQLEMDEKLGVLVDKALLDAGIISEEEFKKRVDIYLDADVDNKDAKDKTDQAVDEVAGSSGGSSTGGKTSNSKISKIKKQIDVEVKADEVDTSDVENKTKEAIEKQTKDKNDELAEALAIETTVELEATIEEAADLIQQFEDKDITIDVTVKGLKDVKELNKNINLATDIKGSVDNLSKYVEGAKALSDLDDNITSKVTAGVYGNVTDFWMTEGRIDNLKVFADSAKDVASIGTVKSKVSADVDGNVTSFWMLEGRLDNLKVFSDSAKDVASIGAIKSKVTADVDGNVTSFWMLEGMLDNLKVFTDSARDVASIGTVKSKVTADVDGNVTSFWMLEGRLDNLKVFTDSAKDVASIGNPSTTVTANVNGNVTSFWMTEGRLDNLKVFSDSAKEVASIGNSSTTVTANIDGNVTSFWMTEGRIDNLKLFSDSAKEVASIGNAESSVTANIDGNVTSFWMTEGRIDNLKVFSDSAKDIASIGSSTSTVTANVDGNVTSFWMTEGRLDNLKVFSEGAKNIASIGNAESTVTANVDGNVTSFWMTEGRLDNLKVFTDSAKEVASIGNAESKVTADIDGNVTSFWMTEGQIDNLKLFTDSAKEIGSIGTVSSKVTADVEGNVTSFWKTEGQLDNLVSFADAARTLNGVGDVSSTVTAKINTGDGAVINRTNAEINRLETFASSAAALKGVGSPTSNVTATVGGNAIVGENAQTYITSLEDFKAAVTGMTSQAVSVTVTASVDSENINTAIDLLTKVSDSGVFKDYKATVQVDAKVATIDDTVVQNYIAAEKTANGKVAWNNDETLVNEFKNKIHEATGKVNWANNTDDVKTSFSAKGTVNWESGNNVKVKVVQMANGTAHVDGTAGRSFAQGNWGIKGNGVALGGELGQELVVRDGRFFTIGDNGAEFFRYKKNDIIFNAAQTESLFKYGGIKGAQPRGKMLASGTAFAEGLAFGGSSGNGGAGSAGGNSSTGQSYGSKDSSSNKDFEEVIDWIEVIIDRVERAIDKFEQQADNIYKSWSSRNKALLNQISKVHEEIDLQQKAYNEYMKAANGVGLSSSWKKKVQNGKIDIETIKDETLAEKIKSYQDYYEKALDCKKAIEELKETEAELYAQRVENVANQYEGVLGVIGHEKSMLEEYISQSEANSQLVSANYYNALVSNEKKNLAQLNKEKTAMLSELEAAMKSGTITKGSEAWYEMVNSVDEVTLAITESQTAILEYQQTIQQLSWESFDLLQEKISAVTEETDFLIELMSNDKLYSGDAQLTNEGSATMGLHGVAYNVNMSQADKYAKEAERLRKQLTKDPYDTELEERYREMISLQREHILAAEGEKEAIRDLVAEGIELELDALQERIDKYNEAIDSAKDLYDYQKQVKEQTEEIASLEKQMSAYNGDTSEEARAKIQELKVSLEEARTNLKETEYDKYISDQQQLLDELYLEYEEILNARLDNLDALISDVITEINNDSAAIGDTIRETADSVGYALSGSMDSIWNGSNSVITTYGDKFTSAQTTTNNTLNTININLQNMITQLNAMAKTNVKSASVSSAKTSKEANATKPSSSTSSSSNKNSSSSSSSSAKSYPYGKASETSGNIKYGARGNAVKAIQYALNQLGYGNSGTKSVDGIFGTGTRSAVKAFQKAMGISADGIVGKNTRAKFKTKGYATGKKNFSDNEVAWTQENGQEFIVRPSDGAILTPIAKGDSVLTSAASSNIWDMANSPTEFIKDNLKLDTANVPNNANVHNNCTQHFDKVVFNMPNVKNYEELLYAMQKDKNFERLILSMSVDRLAGKSSLAKNKSIR